MNLVLGATGFLGGYFARALEESCLRHSSSSRNLSHQDNIVNLAFKEERDIQSIFYNYKFSRVINCIALADIEKCESNIEESNWLNSDIPGIVARLCKKNNIQLIHISTDAVFDGTKAPYKEFETYSPISVYGRTKRNGEINVQKFNEYSQIHRVNFFGTNPRGSSLFDYFYEKLIKGESAHGFTDVKFSTMYAEDTVNNTIHLANSAPPGIYHVTGNESLSKFDFGVAVALEMGLNGTEIMPSSIDLLPGSHLRSKNLTLDNAKLKEYGGVIPGIRTGLKKLIELRKSD